MKGYDPIKTRNYQRAKAEGRLCTRCHYMITVVRWKKGYRLCPDCEDALRGVDVNRGCWPGRDEPAEKTGEMI